MVVPGLRSGPSAALRREHLLLAFRYQLNKRLSQRRKLGMLWVQATQVAVGLLGTADGVQHRLRCD